MAKLHDSVRPTALVLGAGFSKWAANLPVVNRIFDFRIATLNQRDAQRLEIGKRLKKKWDANNPSEHPERYVHDVMVSGTEREKRNVIWYLTRRLSEPFIARMLGGQQTLMIDDRRKDKLLGVRRARSFFRLFNSKSITGIVTPNYDLLVEYALSTGGFNYGRSNETLSGRGKNPWFPWQGDQPKLTGDISLAKVHGSVSWTKEARYTDGRCGLRGDAIIVPPVPEKSAPKLLRDVWDLASRILGAAERVVVFGFAFNLYDKALLELLSSNGSRVKSVLLIDIEPQMARAKWVWPSAEVLCCSPLPAGLLTLTQWLDS